MYRAAGRVRVGNPSMTSRRYQLRLRGIHESPGEIKAKRLIGVLRGLTATAARTIQLRSTGSGRSPKRTPKWIRSTADFTVTGIASGSTAIEIDAPCLGPTASDQFSQLAQWGEKSDLDATALDLATEAINEVTTAKPAGNCFDDAVLGAILKFARAGCNAGVGVELSSTGSKHHGFVLDGQVIQEIAEKRNKIPRSESFIVCGYIVPVRHCYGHFRLMMKENNTLWGRLDNPSSQLKIIQSLQGKRVTLQGVVSFKSNRAARFIETRKIREYVEKDAVFDQVPRGHPSDAQELIAEAVAKRTTKLTDLIGSWPGDETSEELLAELKYGRT